MWLRAGPIVLLLISTIQWISANQACNEGSLRRCLETLQHLVEDEYSFVKKTETELNEYCLSVQKDSTCLTEASDACKKEHRLIAALSVTLFNHLNQLCSPGTDQRRTYLKMLPCFQEHSSDFQKCSGKHIEEEHDDPQLEYVCMDMKSMLCVAETSRKFCGKDGESLAETLELKVKDSYHSVCSGVSGFVFNYLMLASSIFVTLILSNKH